MRRVYGVDFSGARDAGRRIWIARGEVVDGALRIEACHRAADLPGGGTEREPALSALRRLIAADPGAAVGLDFPFGLPAGLVSEGDWESFARGFARRYPDADAFRRAYVAAAGGRELRRLTDIEAATPFSPYNLRIYRQTYTGIRDLLTPLVAAGAACVVPMQPALPGRAWLLEVCPASTLKRDGRYAPYKGRGEARRAGRARILEALELAERVAIPTEVRRAALDDTGGDALDSLLAAVATFRAITDPAFPGPRDSRYAREGRVYV
mgnify:FL=1